MRDWLRLLWHIPVGMLGVAIMGWAVLYKTVFIVNIVVGVVFLASFLVYEIMQDWRKGDKSFKDVIGAVVGIAIGGIILSYLEYMFVL